MFTVHSCVAVPFSKSHIVRGGNKHLCAGGCSFHLFSFAKLAKFFMVFKLHGMTEDAYVIAQKHSMDRILEVT